MEHDKEIYDARSRHLLWLLPLYTFFTLSYYFTLWFVDQEPNTLSSFFNLSQFINYAALYFLVKLLATIPIWWVLFRSGRKYPLRYRMMSHLVFLPLFVWGTIDVYYQVSDLFHFPHLTGNAVFWDLYISGLFYIIQFSVFHGLEMFKTNEQRILDNAELNQLALKNELSALKAQLNPHFLYNIFNTISASVPPESERTRELIAILSDLFRTQLVLTKQEFIPLKDEFAFIDKYLQLEKARFGNRLHYEFNMDANAELVLIPSMIIQPIVENAIKHGISESIEGGSLIINALLNSDNLTIDVSDTGVGTEDPTSLMNNGIGLSNTEKRLNKLYNSSLNIKPVAPSGLSVSFKIPVHKRGAL